MVAASQKPGEAVDVGEVQRERLALLVLHVQFYIRRGGAVGQALAVGHQ